MYCLCLAKAGSFVAMERKEMFSILNYALGCNYALLCFSNVEVINQVKWKDVSEITHLLQQIA